MNDQPERKVRGISPAAAITLAGGAALLGAALAWEIGCDADRWKTGAVFAALALRLAIVAAAPPAFALLLGYSARRILGERAPLSLCLALGWGLLSCGVWALAAAGTLAGRNLFSQWTPLCAMALAAVLLRERIVELGKALGARWRDVRRSERGAATWLVLLMLAAVVVRLVLTALTPSFLYDVLEYHLPDVRWLLATGSLAPIPNNAYATMPQGVEYLFAFARLLEGGLSDYAPKLIHLSLALSTALVLNAMLRDFAVAPWLRALAATLFLSHPVSFELLIDAYVDMGTALYATAAAFCWLRTFLPPSAPANGAQPSQLCTRRGLTPAAIFLGFALSTKHTALGVVVVPFLLSLVPLAPRAAYPIGLGRLTAWARVPLCILVVGLVACAAYSPWLVRSLAYEQTPFPPLTHRLFAPRLDPEFETIRAFMAGAHRLQSPFSAEYGAALWRRVPVAGALLMAGALFALLAPAADRRRRGLGAFALLGYLLWNTRTDSAGRFLAPLLPALAALGVLMVHDLGARIPARARAAAALPALPFAAWALLLLGLQTAQAARSGWLAAGLGEMSREEFLEKQLGAPPARFFQTIEQLAPRKQGGRVLLLYEARAAAIEADSISNTVFDPCPLWMLLRTPLGENPSEVLRELRRRGVTHLAVNEVELARLLRTYPAAEARADPAYREALARAPESGLQAEMLAFRRYYAPFYYFRGGQMATIEKRLDRFLAEARRHVVWEEDLGGARLWIAQIPE